MASEVESATALLRGLPDPVAFFDDDGTIVEASDRIADIGGWRREDLLGTCCFDLFPEHLRDEVVAAFRRWVADGRSPFERRAVRLPVIAADGTTPTVEIRVDRSSHGFVATLRDPAEGGTDAREALLTAVAATAVDTDVLTTMVGQIGEAYGWWRGVLWVADEHALSMRARAVWQRDDSGPGADRFRRRTMQATIVAGQGPVGRAWVDDEVRTEAGDSGAVGDAGAGVYVPVRAGRRPVGVLEFIADDVARPGLWVRSELEALSGGLGQLVDRFRDRLQADALGDRLALALDAGRFGVWTLDVRSGTAEWSPRMAELHGLDPEIASGGPDAVFAHVVEDDRMRLGQAMSASRSQDGTVTVDYRVHPPEAELRWISSRITRVRDNGGPPLLSAVAADISERKRGELAARRRTTAVESLQWVSKAIIAGRELHETAEAVADAATGVLGAERGVVLYPEPGEVSDELAWAVAGSDDDRAPSTPPERLALPAAALTHARVVNVPDVAAAPDVGDFIDRLGLGVPVTGSVLLVPIRGAGGRDLGLMVFTNHANGYFTDDDAEMAASIGSSTGVAIENAQQHEQQRLAAMAFQRQLLPRHELQIPGLEVCVRYHPGRDGMDVGGDWYDLIELDDGRVGLAVGDVCGHGIRSAAHMGQFRYSFRALVQSSSTPAEAFAGVNRLALTELDTTATMAYVELDPRSGSCAVWSCGHLPPLVASADATSVRWLDDPTARGPMLGFLDDIAVTPLRTSLEPGELLMLYTDGLVERRGEHLDDGLDRLAAAFEGRSPVLDDLCDEVYADLAVMGPDADDTVVLAVRRQGGSGINSA